MDWQTCFDIAKQIPRHFGNLLVMLFLVMLGIAMFRDGFVKSIVFNSDSSMRGSFINTAVTIGILTCIIYGAFSEKVANNLKSMETLIIGFYAICFGVWRGGKYLDKRLAGPCPPDGTTTDTTETTTTRTKTTDPVPLPQGPPPPAYQLMPKE